MKLQVISLCLSSLAVQANYATRYWDCCKPSCSWTANAGSVSPMPSCNQANATLSDATVQSACSTAGPSSSYTCFNNVPWAIDANNARGFAAVPPVTSDVCGRCYKLTFTGAGQYGSNPGATALAGKVMIVQASNIGYDVSNGQFDIQIPGGGVGAFNACANQWGVSDLGAQYGGFLSQCQSSYSDLTALQTCVRNKCNTVFGNKPAFAPLLQGCLFFVNWYQCADNPVVNSVEVTCPPELIAVSHMNRGAVAPTNPPPTNKPGTCSSSGQCGCSWASASVCGTSDGSACNAECCCPFRNGGGGTTPTPAAASPTPAAASPTPAPASCPSGNCGCSWANANACGTNDGSTCNIQCCCPYRQQPRVGGGAPIAPNCSDGIQNQDEVQIDCGGAHCAACVGNQWSPSSWSACSKSCGGTQTRDVACVDFTGAMVAASGCTSAKPASTQNCQTTSCDDSSSWAIVPSVSLMMLASLIF